MVNSKTGMPQEQTYEVEFEGHVSTMTQAEMQEAQAIKSGKKKPYKASEEMRAACLALAMKEIYGDE